MQLHTLDKAGLRRVYHEHIKRDFHAAERKPLFFIERLIRQKKYDALGVFEGERLLAYAFLWHDESSKDYALLDYLAVCEGGRGKGTGTAALELLASQYQDYGGILAEVEALDGTPEENALRQRRQEFYLRAGFHRLGYQARLYGVVYDMFATGRADRAAAIEAHARLFGGGSSGAHTRFVEIPYEKS